MMKLFALLALALFCGFAKCEDVTPLAAPVADVPVVTDEVKPVEDAPVEENGKY